MKLLTFIDFMGNSMRSSMLNMILFTYVISFGLYYVLGPYLFKQTSKVRIPSFSYPPPTKALLGVPFDPFEVKVLNSGTSVGVADVLVTVVAIPASAYTLRLRSGIEVRTIRCNEFVLKVPSTHFLDDGLLCSYDVLNNSVRTDINGKAQFYGFTIIGGIPGSAVLYVHVDGVVGVGTATTYLRNPLVVDSVKLNYSPTGHPHSVRACITANLHPQVALNNVQTLTIVAKFISLDINGIHLTTSSPLKYLNDVTSNKVAVWEPDRAQLQLVGDNGTLYQTCVVVRLVSSNTAESYLAVNVFGETVESWSPQDPMPTAMYFDPMDEASVHGVACDSQHLLYTQKAGVPFGSFTCEAFNRHNVSLVNKSIFIQVETIFGTPLPPFGVPTIQLEDCVNVTNSSMLATFSKLSFPINTEIGMYSLIAVSEGKMFRVWSGNLTSGWSRIESFSTVTSPVLTIGSLWTEAPRFVFYDMKGIPAPGLPLTVTSIPPNLGIQTRVTISQSSVIFSIFNVTYSDALTPASPIALYKLQFSINDVIVLVTPVFVVSPIPIPPQQPPIPPEKCDVAQACSPRVRTLCNWTFDSIGSDDADTETCYCEDMKLLCQASQYKLSGNPECAPGPTVSECRRKTKDCNGLAGCLYNPDSYGIGFMWCLDFLNVTQGDQCAAVDAFLGCTTLNGGPSNLGCMFAWMLQCNSTLQHYNCTNSSTSSANLKSLPTPSRSIRSTLMSSKSCAMLIPLQKTINTTSGTPVYISFQAVDMFGNQLTEIMDVNLTIIEQSAPIGLMRWRNCSNITNSMQCFMASACMWDYAANTPSCAYASQNFVKVLNEFSLTSYSGLVEYFDTVFMGYPGVYHIQAAAVSGECTSVPIPVFVHESVHSFDIKRIGDNITVTVLSDAPALIDIQTISRPLYVREYIQHESHLQRMSVVATSIMYTLNTTTLMYTPGNYLFGLRVNGMYSRALSYTVLAPSDWVYELQPLDVGGTNIMTCKVNVTTNLCEAPCVQTSIDIRSCYYPNGVQFSTIPMVQVLNKHGKPINNVNVIVLLDAIIDNVTVTVDFNSLQLGALGNFYSGSANQLVLAVSSDADGYATFSDLQFFGGSAMNYSLRFAVFFNDSYRIEQPSKYYFSHQPRYDTVGCPSQIVSNPGGIISSISVQLGPRYLIPQWSQSCVGKIMTDSGTNIFVPDVHISRSGLDGLWFGSVGPKSRLCSLGPLQLDYDLDPSDSSTLIITVPGGTCAVPLNIINQVSLSVSLCQPSVNISIGITITCDVYAYQYNTLSPAPGVIITVSSTLKSAVNQPNLNSKTCTGSECGVLQVGGQYIVTDVRGYALLALTFTAGVSGTYELSVTAVTRIPSATFITQISKMNAAALKMLNIPRDVAEDLKSSSVAFEGSSLVPSDDDNPRSDPIIVPVFVRNDVFAIEILQSPIPLASSIYPSTDVRNSLIFFLNGVVKLVDINGNPVSGKVVQLQVVPEGKLRLRPSPPYVSDVKGKVLFDGIVVVSGDAGTYQFVFIADGVRSVPSTSFTFVDANANSFSGQLSLALVYTIVFMLPIFRANHPESSFTVMVIAVALMILFTYGTYTDSLIIETFDGRENIPYAFLAWLCVTISAILSAVGLFGLVITYVLGYFRKLPKFQVLKEETRAQNTVQYTTQICNLRQRDYDVIHYREQSAFKSATKIQSLTWNLWFVGYRDPTLVRLKWVYPQRFLMTMVVSMVLIVLMCVVTWRSTEYVSALCYKYKNEITDPRPLKDQIEFFQQMMIQYFQPGQPFAMLAPMATFLHYVNLFKVWLFCYDFIQYSITSVEVVSITATVLCTVFVFVHWCILFYVTRDNLKAIRKGKLFNQEEVRKVCGLVSAESYVGLQMVHFALAFLLMLTVVVSFSLLVMVVTFLGFATTILLEKLAYFSLTYMVYPFVRWVIVGKLLTDGLFTGHPNFYNLFSYFELVLGIPLALFNTLKRWLLALLSFLLFAPRLDLQMYAVYFIRHDSGYTSYWSMLFVEEQYNNPIACVFIAHLHQYRLINRQKKVESKQSAPSSSLLDQQDVLLNTNPSTPPVENGIEVSLLGDAANPVEENTEEEVNSHVQLSHFEAKTTEAVKKKEVKTKIEEEIKVSKLPPHLAAIHQILYPSVDAKQCTQSKTKQRLWLWFLLEKHATLRPLRKMRLKKKIETTDVSKKETVSDVDVVPVSEC